MPDLNLGDLDRFLDGKRFTFSVDGKKYTVTEATGEQFLRLQRYGAVLNIATSPDDPAAAEFEALTQNDLSELALGKSVLDQMVKNNVVGSAVERVTLAAFFWHIGQGAEVVKAAFEGGKARKAPRKAPSPKKTAPTTRSAAANTTRRRASGTGTSTRRNS